MSVPNLREDFSPDVIRNARAKKRYKVVITEYSNEIQLKGGEWKQGADDTTTSTFGYTPNIERIVEVERTVLQQEVTELDMVAVIKAVNGIVDIDMTL
jgi:phage tail tube protein FII